MNTIRRGMLVAIEFDDHVEDGSKPERFVVYGRVARVRKESICIDSWAYPNPRKRFDPNVKRFTILRRVIVGVKELVEKSWTSDGDGADVTRTTPETSQNGANPTSKSVTPEATASHGVDGITKLETAGLGTDNSSEHG